MMDKKLANDLAGLNTEERAAHLAGLRSELASAQLASVNGGGENPNSSVPYGGNWRTSLGYICEGVRVC